MFALQAVFLVDWTVLKFVVIHDMLRVAPRRPKGTLEGPGVYDCTTHIIFVITIGIGDGDVNKSMPFIHSAGRMLNVAVCGASIATRRPCLLAGKSNRNAWIPRA